MLITLILSTVLESWHFMPKAMVNHLKVLKGGNCDIVFHLKQTVAALMGKDLTDNKTWAEHQIACDPGENLW